ncbi:MAG: OsmC family protein [Leuconostoc gelidum]|jgi:osmotically inducible protein OsmC|uniref:OsmC family protein n=1 Tax=Leuconostoc gelidum subsp. gelidum TaxID=1607839 RepID=A0AB35FW16_LEUGE|nr:OsmC family protein [Leuconostoc gelidum]MBZ5964021.1 OsmC family protein [Leuconostoc gelidum subsp. gelidum]MBZ5974238.1 OsmC family protein [Leuconostoc gelidum subsp. gelidum]MBZ5976053.1 OsmC family protein [Leuconostoc gelidum subsp. gelidum]MBZ5978743.1 OsmC family protein [Leuconostoc gelidum subsp. gelidum]MBZ5985902.1 OsmC family protein [Leuconostoc gelidum subsp. gelidum]
MTNESLYHTEIENTAGLVGHVKTITTSDLSVQTSGPLSDEPGTNPEQLLGAALATCLNATIEAEEKRRQLEHKSVVRVGVDMARDAKGFQFFVTAQVKIPHVNRQEAEDMLAIVAQRCPVSKLLSGSSNVQIMLVDDFNFKL